MFLCRNRGFQRDLHLLCFSVMGPVQLSGIVIAPVVLIGLQRGNENGDLGRKLTQLHVTFVAAGVLTGSAWFSSEGGHTR